MSQSPNIWNKMLMFWNFKCPFLWMSTSFVQTGQLRGNTGRENKRQRDANNTTLMLIVVISVFLSVELPLMMMSALHTINSSMELDFMDYQLANTITMFINTAIFLSYPINFGIYCGMSRYEICSIKENILLNIIFWVKWE